MKSSYAALAVIGLLLAGLWFIGGGTTVPPQAAAAAEQPRVSAPVSHENLTVFFIHGPDTVADTHKVGTLQEALEGGWAVVHETGNVNELMVENLSDDHELFIQEGEMIRGGKQDRMIGMDMLLPPKSGRVPFPAHCVEQGRWTGRGNEAATHFNKSDQLAAGNELRYANASGQQPAVWENVKKNQDKLTKNLGTKVNAEESESSFQLALENRVLQERIAAFEAALRAGGENRKNVVGVVFLVNGQVRGAEVYGSNTLFQKAWPKLLRSAAVDAVAEKNDKACPPPPTAGEVERFLALAGNEAPAGATYEELPTGGVAGVVVLTDGNSNQAFSGRSGSTRNRTVRSGSGQGSGQGMGQGAGLTNEDVGLDNNVRVVDVQVRQADGTVVTQQQRVTVTQTRAPNPPGQPAPARALVLTNPAPNAGREEVFQTEGRVLRPQTEAMQTEGRPALVNPDGNRLNVNRVENPAGLTTESRDPNRQNAVIHKSFIKK